MSKKEILLLIDELISSKTSKHSKEDRQKLHALKKAVQTAKTIEDGGKILLEFAKYLGIIINAIKDS